MCRAMDMYIWKRSLWRRANARNVTIYYPYWQYTDLFIFRFIYYVRVCVKQWSSTFFRIAVDCNTSSTRYKFGIRSDRSATFGLKRPIYHMLNLICLVHLSFKFRTFKMHPEQKVFMKPIISSKYGCLSGRNRHGSHKWLNSFFYLRGPFTLRSI